MSIWEMFISIQPRLSVTHLKESLLCSHIIFEVLIYVGEMTLFKGAFRPERVNRYSLA